ncbi:hypothetical protein ABT093_39515 [Kitasatospora sp. NPDC002551]
MSRAHGWLPLGAFFAARAERTRRPDHDPAAGRARSAEAPLPDAV